MRSLPASSRLSKRIVRSSGETVKFHRTDGSSAVIVRMWAGCCLLCDGLPMGPAREPQCFHHHPTGWASLQPLPESFRRRPQRASFGHLALPVQHAVLALLVAQIDADRNLLPPRRRLHAIQLPAILLHGRSPVWIRWVLRLRSPNGPSRLRASGDTARFYVSFSGKIKKKGGCGRGQQEEWGKNPVEHREELLYKI